MPATIKIDRKQLEATAEKLIEKSRVRLLLNTKDARSVFFAALGLRLRLQADWSFPTAAVDGRSLFYNPAFISGLTDAEFDGVHIHEILHCSNAHHARRGDRDPFLWNVACDLSINQIVLDCGMTLPKGCLLVGVGDFAKYPRDLAAEQYYDLLVQDGHGDKPQDDGDEGGEGGDQDGEGEGEGDGDPSDGDSEGEGQPGDGGRMPKRPKGRKPGKGSGEPGEGEGGGEGEGPEGQPGGDSCDPGQCGGVIDAPGIEGSPAKADAEKAEWEIEVAKAAEMAKQRGTLPGSIERMIAKIVHPAQGWKDELADFFGRVFDAQDDYSFRHHNRRFIGQGLYLPSIRSESLGRIVIAVDTSGSIGERELKAFASHINGILEARPSQVSIVYCDARVNRVDEWKRDEGELRIDHFPGGGGTSHCPVWAWVEQQDDGEPIEAVVCLTDGWTDFGKEPRIPVLWALTCDVQVPWGRKLLLNEKGV